MNTAARRSIPGSIRCNSKDFNKKAHELKLVGYPLLYIPVNIPPVSLRRGLQWARDRIFPPRKFPSRILCSSFSCSHIAIFPRPTKNSLPESFVPHFLARTLPYSPAPLIPFQNPLHFIFLLAHSIFHRFHRKSTRNFKTAPKCSRLIFFLS